MTFDIGLRSTQPRFESLKGVALTPLVTAVAYLLGAEAAFQVGTLSDRMFAPFWPPNIVLFCALLVVPPRRWWMIVAATFPVHVLAELRIGMPPDQQLLAFAANWLVAALNATLARWVLGELPWFGNLKKTALYILITAVASPAIAAFGGAFLRILGGGDIGHYPTFWAQWYLSNALGSLTIGPIFLIWLGARGQFHPPVLRRQMVEGIVLGVLLVAVCAIAFKFSAGKVASGFIPAILYSPLPLILWSATRFGERGASGAILLVTVVLLGLSLNSSSLFIEADPEMNVLALQVFLIGLSVPVLLLGAAIDQLRRAERATRESEERMEFAAASANIGLWYFAPSSGEMWMTEHCRSMLGLAAEAPLTSAAVQAVIHPDDRQAVVDSTRLAAYAGKEVVGEFRVVLPNSQIRWLRTHAQADRDESGRPFRISGVFTDMTAAKAAEHEAARQRSELAHLMRVSAAGELSGAIAHEINQPLTAILSNAQAARLMLADQRPELADVGEAIDDIVHEGKRAGDVIERLRGLLKKGESRLEPIDLNELIESTLQLLHSELIGRRVRVARKLARDLPPLYGDPVQVQQVLLNLVMNAMDAMSATLVGGRMVTITTRHTDKDEAEIIVADRGHGLQPADHAKVFEPFFTTKVHGLGLGLSICSTIVTAHGGQLKLVNDPDGGARASFTLPHHRIAMAAK